ncbi:MAG: hypothetical protein ACPGUV_02700 [Polyangiales bacterium]
MSAVLYLGACDGTGDGDAQFLVSAEESIAAGLEPGVGSENIVDGWQVRYTQFLIVVGNFYAASTEAPSSPLQANGSWLVDLTRLPPTGVQVASFPGVPGRRYDQVRYETPVATIATQVLDPALAPERDAMASRGWSHSVVGTARKEGRTLRFAWGFAAPTRYDNCGPEEGDTGFAVPEGSSGQADFSLHGDHFWFNAFPGGSEAAIERRAEWLSRADGDSDGHVTLAELEATSAALLFPNDRYELQGAPRPEGVRHGLDWVRGQAATLGHFQGEGECIWTVL